MLSLLVFFWELDIKYNCLKIINLDWVKEVLTNSYNFKLRGP